MSFLAKTGMAPKERRSKISNLRILDYGAGPERDYNNPDDCDIWKFKIRYLNSEIYVKIKLTEGDDGFHAICQSFHD